MRICVIALNILRELAADGYSRFIRQADVMKCILDVIDEP